MSAIDKLNTANDLGHIADSRAINYTDSLVTFLAGIIDGAIEVCQNFEYLGKCNIVEIKRAGYRIYLEINHMSDSDVTFSFNRYSELDRLGEECEMPSIDIFNYSSDIRLKYIDLLTSEIESSRISVEKVYKLVSNNGKVYPQDYIRDRFFSSVVRKCNARYLKQNVEMFRDENGEYTSEDAVLANILIDYWRKVLYIIDLYTTVRNGIKEERYKNSYSDSDMCTEICAVRYCFNSVHFCIKYNDKSIFYLDSVGVYYDDINIIDINRAEFNEFKRRNSIGMEQLFKHFVTVAEGLLNVKYQGSYEQYINELSSGFDNFISSIVNKK